MSDDDLYRALLVLREAEDPGAPELIPRWRVVLRALEGFGRTVGGGLLVDREEAVAESLLKVHRRIGDLAAREPSGACAWLRSVYRNTFMDVVRNRRNRHWVYDEPSFDDEDREGMFERMAAPEPDIDPELLDPARLAPYEDALFDRIDAYVAARFRPVARPNARRNAEISYERIVRGRSTDSLVAEMGGTIRPDTLYQWVRRGREEVLVPVLETWMGEGGSGEADRAFAETLLGILRSRERRDAGRPRPERRKGADGPAGGARGDSVMRGEPPDGGG